jgi:hypothetical protein
MFSSSSTGLSSKLVWLSWLGLSLALAGLWMVETGGEGSDDESGWVIPPAVDSSLLPWEGETAM